MSEDPKPQLTEDMVRALLKMNPHLRGDGQSTKDVLELTRGQTEKAPAPAVTPAQAKKTRDLDSELAALSREHAAWALAHAKEKEAAQKRLAALTGDEQVAKTTAGDRILQAFVSRDPSVKEAENVALLTQEKAFLEEVGFSLQKLLALKRKQ